MIAFIPARRLAAPGLLAFAALVGFTACADAPSSPIAAAGPPSAPRFGVVGRVQQATVGDTTVTKFTLAPGTVPTPILLGNDSKIDIPDGASSICDRATSSYGLGEWDKPCAPSATNVTITAKTWRDASGLARSEFHPALRFVPTAARPVVLYLKNKDGRISAGMRVDFCTQGSCVNEAAVDPSVATTVDKRTGVASRRVKHFSGYNVVFGTDGAQ